MATTRKTSSKSSSEATSVEEEYISKAELEQRLATMDTKNEERHKSLEDKIDKLFAMLAHKPSPVEITAESPQGVHRPGKEPEGFTHAPNLVKPGIIPKANEGTSTSIPLPPCTYPGERPLYMGNEVSFRHEPPRYNIAHTEEMVPWGQPRGDPRIRRLEMPLFHGENVNQWVYKAERYFEVNGLVGPEALAAATVCLEGKAFDWWSYFNKIERIQTWNHFKEAIISRFSGANQTDIKEQFFSLIQNRTVLDYREKFERLLGAIEGYDDETLMAIFLRGLKSEIRVEVKLLEPNSLQRAMKLAQMVEDKNNSLSRTSHSSTHNSAPRPRHDATRDVPQRPPFPQPQRATPTEGRNTLCFRCKEPWVAGHRCGERALRMVEGITEEEEDVTDMPKEQPAVEDCDEDTEVSLNSMTYITPSQAMKMRGILGNRQVIVLIDSGATHNFISSELMEQEGLKFIDRGNFKVKLGTCITKEGQGYCPKVEVRLANYQIETDFLPFPLGGTDIILGMQWLQTLGDVEVNWKTLTMEFMNEGQRIRLCGDPSLSKKEILLQAITKKEDHKAPTAVLNQVFKPNLQKFVLVFFDDITYSKFKDEHKEDMKMAWGELEKHELNVNPMKCHFGKRSAEYLDLYASRDEVSTEEVKKKAIRDWPLSENIRELQGFLRLYKIPEACGKDHDAVFSNFWTHLFKTRGTSLNRRAANHPQTERLWEDRKGPKGYEVLIMWTSGQEHDSTWKLEKVFPLFDLEDKIVLWGGRPDMSAVVQENDPHDQPSYPAQDHHEMARITTQSKHKKLSSFGARAGPEGPSKIRPKVQENAARNLCKVDQHMEDVWPNFGEPEEWM